MSGGFNLDDYVDVAERIRLFYERFPDGRLVTVRHGRYVTEDGHKEFVFCEARAYRIPDDPQPCAGTAWEPIPGATPYTRDSELMNAETAAWGRAIIAAGIPSKKIASADEVQARQSAPAVSTEARTTAQNSLFHALYGELDKIDPRPEGPWEDYGGAWILENFGKHSSKELTKGEAGQLIDHLQALKKKAVAAAPFG
jgi:hypothetical protein